MRLTYTLSENDYLQYQLFIASKNERIKKERIKSWLIYSASLLLMSFVFYDIGNKFMTYFLLVFGIIVLCFFPLYQKRYYKNHYQKFITETYKNRFGKAGNIYIAENHIEVNDITGEAKINLTEIENAIETSAYFYLKIKTGGHFIIPKKQLNEIENIGQELKKLCSKFSIDFVEDFNWRWK